MYCETPLYWDWLSSLLFYYIWVACVMCVWVWVCGCHLWILSISTLVFGCAYRVRLMGSKGCSNNNYASRERCNKCGEPKEVAALPAMSLPGAAMAAPALPRPTAAPMGGLGLGMNAVSPMPLYASRPSGSNWPFSSTNLSGSMADDGNWRLGDWFCPCGYRNYSSRSMCKNCQAPITPGASLSGGSLPSMQPPMYPGLGVKRLASDDLGVDFASKRLNLGGEFAPLALQNQPHPFGALSGFGSSAGFTVGGSLPPPKWTMQPPQPSGMTLVPAILGKGAKQWRVGDWMCAGCNNHNFASRASCNRCGGQREIMAQALPVA